MKGLEASGDSAGRGMRRRVEKTVQMFPFLTQWCRQEGGEEMPQGTGVRAQGRDGVWSPGGGWTAMLLVVPVVLPGRAILPATVAEVPKRWPAMRNWLL